MSSTTAAASDRPARMFGNCTYEEIEDAYRTSVHTVLHCAPDFRRHEAMDASHDAALVWLELVREGKYTRTRAKLSTLACGIALRKLWRRLEKIAAEGKKHVSISGAGEPAQPTPVVARWSDDEWRKEVLDALDAGLECLNETQRAVILRYYAYGSPYHVIGFELGFPVGTVRSIAFRARQRWPNSRGCGPCCSVNRG